MNRIYTPGMTVINTVAGATTTYVTHKPNTALPGTNACNMQVCIAMANATGGTLEINSGTYKHSTATFTIDATNPRKAYIDSAGGRTNTVFIGYVTKGVGVDSTLDTSPAFQITAGVASIGNVYIEGSVLQI